MKTALGIDIGASTTKAAIVSSDGTFRDRKEIATDHNRLVDQLVEFVKRFNQLDFGSIGIGFPGLVERNVVIRAGNLPIENLPLGDQIHQAIQKKVSVSNDADAALMGELWLGAAKGKKKVILLTLGSGIGGAIFDKPNAELGHTVIDPGSVLTCNLGHRGDIESLIGGIATQKRLGKPSRELLRDPSYQSFFVTWLARSIETLINQYQPELVVLGGGMIEQAQYFFNKLPHFSVPVVLASLGQNAAIVGAAHMTMKGGLLDWLS